MQAFAARTVGLGGTQLRALCAFLTREANGGPGEEIGALVSRWDRPALHAKRATSA